MARGINQVTAAYNKVAQTQIDYAEKIKQGFNEIQNYQNIVNQEDLEREALKAEQQMLLDYDENNYDEEQFQQLSHLQKQKILNNDSLANKTKKELLNQINKKEFDLRRSIRSNIEQRDLAIAKEQERLREEKRKLIEEQGLKQLENRAENIIKIAKEEGRDPTSELQSLFTEESAKGYLSEGGDIKARTIFNMHLDDYHTDTRITNIKEGKSIQKNTMLNEADRLSIDVANRLAELSILHSNNQISTDQAIQERKNIENYFYSGLSKIGIEIGDPEYNVYTKTALTEFTSFDETILQNDAIDLKDSKDTITTALVNSDYKMMVNEAKTLQELDEIASNFLKTNNELDISTSKKNDNISLMNTHIDAKRKEIQKRENEKLQNAKNRALEINKNDIIETILIKSKNGEQVFREIELLRDNLKQQGYLPEEVDVIIKDQIHTPILLSVVDDMMEEKDRIYNENRANLNMTGSDIMTNLNNSLGEIDATLKELENISSATSSGVNYEKIEEKITELKKYRNTVLGRMATVSNEISVYDKEFLDNEKTFTEKVIKGQIKTNEQNLYQSKLDIDSLKVVSPNVLNQAEIEKRKRQFANDYFDYRISSNAAHEVASASGLFNLEELMIMKNTREIQDQMKIDDPVNWAINYTGESEYRELTYDDEGKQRFFSGEFFKEALGKRKTYVETKTGAEIKNIISDNEANIISKMISEIPDAEQLGLILSMPELRNPIVAKSISIYNPRIGHYISMQETGHTDINPLYINADISKTFQQVKFNTTTSLISTEEFELEIEDSLRDKFNRNLTTEELEKYKSIYKAGMLTELEENAANDSNEKLNFSDLSKLVLKKYFPNITESGLILPDKTNDPEKTEAFLNDMLLIDSENLFPLMMNQIEIETSYLVNGSNQPVEGKIESFGVAVTAEGIPVNYTDLENMRVNGRLRIANYSPLDKEGVYYTIKYLDQDGVWKNFLTDNGKDIWHFSGAGVNKNYNHSSESKSLITRGFENVVRGFIRGEDAVLPDSLPRIGNYLEARLERGVVNTQGNKYNTNVIIKTKK